MPIPSYIQPSLQDQNVNYLPAEMQCTQSLTIVTLGLLAQPGEEGLAVCCLVICMILKFMDHTFHAVITSDVSLKQQVVIIGIGAMIGVDATPSAWPCGRSKTDLKSHSDDQGKVF